MAETLSGSGLPDMRAEPTFDEKLDFNFERFIIFPDNVNRQRRKFVIPSPMSQCMLVLHYLLVRHWFLRT